MSGSQYRVITHAAREEACFQYSNNNSTHNQARKGFGDPLTNGNNPPECHHGTQDHGGSPVFQEYVARHFEKNVGNEEHLWIVRSVLRPKLIYGRNWLQQTTFAASMEGTPRTTYEEGDVVVGAVHVEVLFEPLNSRIADVDSEWYERLPQLRKTGLTDR